MKSKIHKFKSVKKYAICKKLILTISLLSFLALGSRAQIMINGQAWKPKTKEQKEADKKAREDEKALNKFSKSELKQLLDMSAYPDLETDKQKLMGIAKIYNTGGRYPTVDEVYKRINEYPASDQSLDVIKEKYKDYFAARWQKCRQDEEYKAQQMARKDDIEEWHVTAQKRTDEFHKYISDQYYYEAAKKMLTEVLAEIEAARKGMKVSDNSSDDAYGSGKRLNTQVPGFTKEFKDAEYYNKCIAFIYGSDSKELAEITSLKKECESDLELAKKESKEAAVRNEEIAKQERKKQDEAEESHHKADLLAEIEKAKNTKCPVDKYAGADKQALKNLVIKEWKENAGENVKLIKVYITGSQWERFKGYSRDGSSYNKYDNSKLAVAIIYQTNNATEAEAKVALVEYSYVWKNHINGNKMNLGKDGNSQGPEYIYLSNIK